MLCLSQVNFDFRRLGGNVKKLHQCLSRRTTKGNVQFLKWNQHYSRQCRKKNFFFKVKTVSFYLSGKTTTWTNDTEERSCKEKEPQRSKWDEMRQEELKQLRCKDQRETNFLSRLKVLNSWLSSFFICLFVCFKIYWEQIQCQTQN